MKSKKEIKHNFLPEQYNETAKPQINHNYLREQFSDYKEIFKEIEKLVYSGDYTLGKAVDEFENNICRLTGSKYAVGVASGTDALMLSLKALGVKEGDEVITAPYTFFATIASIANAGAKPVFADIREDYTINPDLVERAITNKTKAILPVHWSGLCCDMEKLANIAKKHNIAIVEDACHAINGTYHGKHAGTFGDAGCFSMHPLKNLNVWGDGGFIVTNLRELHDKLALLRNHGLVNRDESAFYGYNSRLDSLQAIVANHLLKKLDHITDSRIRNAQFFDKELGKIPEIIIPKRDAHIKQVFHIYVIKAKDRDNLQKFLIKNEIDAKIHYPIPMHLQPAAKKLGYKEGDFPVAEEVCKSVISLPVHEFVTRGQQEYIVEKIKEFYNGRL